MLHKNLNVERAREWLLLKEHTPGCGTRLTSGPAFSPGLVTERDILSILACSLSWRAGYISQEHSCLYRRENRFVLNRKQRFG